MILIKGMSKEFGRRSFIITAGTAGILLGSRLLLSELRVKKEQGSRIEPNTQRSLEYFTFANLMRDYLVSIDESVLKKETKIRNIPLGDSQNTLALLLPGNRLPDGGIVDIVKSSENEKVKIRIAGGAAEQVIKRLTDSGPNRGKEQGLLSPVLSDQLFSGLAGRGFILGYYSESEAKAKSEDYLRSLLGNNPPLIAHMYPKARPGFFV